MFGFNIVLTVLTFVAYALPFLAPKLFPLLSVLTLILPLFLILNAFFFVYWLLQLKRQVILSGLVLLLGITFINKFYKFSSRALPEEEKDFTVMSYNVRLFNLFEWLPNEHVGDTILSFINDQNPDIICLQEYSESAKVNLRAYKYKAIFMEGKQKGAHEWMIEFKTPPKDLTLFHEILDSTLQSLNSDYEAKRYNNMTLNPLVINVARENLFYDWLKQRNKVGGQNKIPRLSNQRDYLEQLKALQS